MSSTSLATKEDKKSQEKKQSPIPKGLKLQEAPEYPSQLLPDQLSEDYHEKVRLSLKVYKADRKRGWNAWGSVSAKFCKDMIKVNARIQEFNDYVDDTQQFLSVQKKTFRAKIKEWENYSDEREERIISLEKENQEMRGLIASFQKSVNVTVNVIEPKQEAVSKSLKSDGSK